MQFSVKFFLFPLHFLIAGFQHQVFEKNTTTTFMASKKQKRVERGSTQMSRSKIFKDSYLIRAPVGYLSIKFIT